MDEYDSSFFDTKRAAAWLDLSLRTLDGYRVSGEGPAFHRFGNRVRYRLADLDAWAAERRATTTAEADRLRRCEGALAKLRDLQVDRACLHLPDAVALDVAPVDAIRRTLAMGGASRPFPFANQQVTTIALAPLCADLSVGLNPNLKAVASPRYTPTVHARMYRPYWICTLSYQSPMNNSHQ